MALEDVPEALGSKLASEARSQIERSPLVFNPGAGRLPPPEAMAAYAAIDPTYPQFLKEIFSAELKRNYQYQLIALLAGWSFGALLLRALCFWFMQDILRWLRR
jgi:hypothetical protein